MISAEFPQVNTMVNGQRLVYLDSAATTLKPQIVIDRLTHYYSTEVSNIHRGAHYLGAQGTDAYEQVRAEFASWMGVHSQELVFTRGTTEGLNLLAAVLPHYVNPNKPNAVVTGLEHHSNWVPWQRYAKRTGGEFRMLPVTVSGEIDISSLAELLDDRVGVVSLSQISNVLGHALDLKPIIRRAREVGAVIIVDSAQAAVLGQARPADLDCDFLVFSGHKIFGPTGIGVLWGQPSILNQLPPYQVGGGMISEVAFERSSYLAAPHRFEAGTQHVAGVLGMGAALDFMMSVGVDQIRNHELDLTRSLRQELKVRTGCHVLGPDRVESGITSFVFDGVHSADLAEILDQQGVAVRAGHLCAQPLMKLMNWTQGVVRVSFSVYNTEDDLHLLLKALDKALGILR